MKILVIGDIHGLNVWKKLIVEHSPDKVVFLGDYVDSFIAPDGDVIQNLRDIIKYKRFNRDKCILLLGNHDVQYIYKGNNCSGRRSSYAGIIGDLFKQREPLFKIIHKEGKYIFSHAGLTNGWIEDNKKILDEYFPDGFIIDEVEILNNILHTHNNNIIFQCGNGRGGFAKESGPLWADKSELELDGIKSEYTQIVGHSKVNKITYLPGMVFCDNLEYGDGVPLILDI